MWPVSCSVLCCLWKKQMNLVWKQYILDVRSLFWIGGGPSNLWNHFLSDRYMLFSPQCHKLEIDGRTWVSAACQGWRLVNCPFITSGGDDCTRWTWVGFGKPAATIPRRLYVCVLTTVPDWNTATVPTSHCLCACATACVPMFRLRWKISLFSFRPCPSAPKYLHGS